MNTLATRIEQAAKADPRWWLAHVEKAEPGEPLPYDRRIGLSKSEYREFLALKMSVQKTGDAVLHVTKKGDNVYLLDGGASLPNLTGIEIDLAEDVVRTPFGVVRQRSDVAIDESAIGAWNGTRWHFEEVAPRGSITTVTFAVGKLIPSGRGVIHYTAKQITAAGRTRIRQILFFDVPSGD